MLSSPSIAAAPLRLLTLLACVALPAVVQATQPPLKFAPQPLAFEPNRGQTNPQVSYLARGKGYLLFLEPAGAVLSLKTSAAPKVLRMHLVDTAAHPTMRGDSRLPGRHNYYIGNDPKRWHTAIPTYGRVSSVGIYPGIDMVYHGRDGQLEYDFIVAPRADPRAIRLAFAGSDAMTVNDRGDLILDVGGEKVVQRAPYAYQAIGDKKVAVASRYAVKGKTVSFALGRYDTAKPLIIDPALIYASYLGGTGDDQARAVAVDGSGHIYLAGMTASPGFPGSSTTQGPSAPAGGSSDAFVTMLDSSGAVLFSTYLGSYDSFGAVDPNNIEPSGEKANGIAVSSAGKIYVTGGTGSHVTNPSSTFPTSSGAYQTCGINVNSVFVSILNNDGSLNYSTCVGTAVGEEGYGIAVDDVDNAYVVGWTNAGYQPGVCTVPSCLFPTTGGALQNTKNTPPNLTDSFFFKLNPTTAGTGGLVYSTYLGSTLDALSTCCNTYATAVAVDKNRVAYVAGWTDNESTGVLAPDFQKALSNAGSTYSGGRDAFFYVIDPTLAAPLQYATYLGGSGDDMATGIAVDNIGNVYLAGQTASSNFPATTGAYQAAFQGGKTDAFGAKFNFTGGSGVYNYSPGYVTYLGGAGDDAAAAVAVDSTTGRAHVTGATASGNFPVVAASVLQGAINQGKPTGLTDAFVVSLEASGYALHYSTFLGGSGADQGLGIAVAQDGSEKVYVVGGTSSTDFPVTPNAAQKANQGGVDAFVAEISPAADMGISGFTVNPQIPQLLQTLSYTITAKNYGPDAATNAKLTLTISCPSCSAPLDSSSITMDSRCSFVSSTWTFSCNLGGMAAGATIPLSFGGSLSTPQTVTAVATTSADQTDTNAANNSVTATSTAGKATTPPPIIVGSGGSSGGGSGGGSSGGGGGIIGPLALLVMLPAAYAAAPRNRRT